MYFRNSPLHSIFFCFDCPAEAQLDSSWMHKQIRHVDRHFSDAWLSPVILIEANCWLFPWFPTWDMWLPPAPVSIEHFYCSELVRANSHTHSHMHSALCPKLNCYFIKEHDMAAAERTFLNYTLSGCLSVVFHVYGIKTEQEELIDKCVRKQHWSSVCAHGKKRQKVTVSLI